MPTYDQLVEAYSSKQRLEENAIDLDYDFLEEQRSNEERRYIYKTLEAMIEKWKNLSNSPLFISLFNQIGCIIVVLDSGLGLMGKLAWNEPYANWPMLHSDIVDWSEDSPTFCSRKLKLSSN